ncbi:MAG: hypothetical protein ACYC27_02950 [Armatimonadota bacterium]
MKLHNRQIKGEFWTDAEIQYELDGLGRLAYLGFIQIADDSGCLANDPRAINLLVFSVDTDMTVERITSYINRLIDLGKLIQYEVDGKPYLFLKNFHKHQALRSPSAPSVPLPSWIKWVQSEKNYRSGTYEISNLTETVEKPYGNRTEAVRQPYGNCTETVPSSSSSSSSSSCSNEDKSVDIVGDDPIKKELEACSWCEKPKKETSGVQFLLQQMHNHYRDRFGVCPNVVPGRDGSLFRSLLKGRTEALILQIYGKYLNITDPFYEKQGYSIPLFIQQFDGIRMRGDTDGSTKRDKLTDLDDPRL